MAARQDTSRFQEPALALRDEHLAEGELIAFARQVLNYEERQEALAHLDTCKRCRDRLEELHREEDGNGSTKLSDPLLGRMLGEYRVEQALSRGGMGAVYRGLQPVIGKKVAIKVLLPDIAGDQNTMHRLLEEARAVNAIRHPNIIDVFSFGDLPDGRHYFIMELLDGLALDELLAQKGRLTASEVMTVLEQAMSALGAAHAAKVIHRDLKPANLFVTTLPDQSWHVTVLDFGLAKRLGSSSGTMPNLVMGTPGFMAPEQIRGQEVTARTDLYAMGVVAWVLLTGQEPFSAPSTMELLMAHLEQPLPALLPLAPGCPPQLARLVERLLAKRPDDRPQTAIEVQTELQRIRHERAAKPAALVAPPQPRAPRASAPRPPPPRAAEPTQLIPRTAKAEVAATAVETPVLVPRSRVPLFIAGGLAAVVVLAGIGFALSGSSQQVDPPKVETPPTKVETPPTKVEALPTKVETPPTEVETPTKVETPPTKVEAPPTKVETPPTKVEAPLKPVRPTAGAGPSAAAVRKRLEQARETAAQLTASSSRRMMNLDLDRLETRLKSGEPAREINRDLSEVLERYKGP